MKGALIINLHSEETLLELTLRIDRVLLGLLGNDLNALVKDAVRVYHAFVSVLGRLNQLL